MAGIEESDIRFLRLAAALADWRMHRMLEVMGDQRLQSMDDLQAESGMGADEVGRQLQVLGAAGVLRTLRDGATRRYQLDYGPLINLGVRLDAESNEGGRIPPAGLKQFFRDDRIVQIPAARKKQIELLQWLVDDFSFDTDYPEAEVNAILARRHPDFATLRRDLVDECLMERTAGVYRRTRAQTTPL